MQRLPAILALLPMGAAVLLGAAPTTATAAIPAAKEPWHWSLDERLEARVAMARHAKTLSASPGTLSARPTYTIRGASAPHLFLEWELFDALVESGFPERQADRANSRESFMARAAALGFGADFWQRFERAAAPFLRVRRQDLEQAAREAGEAVPKVRSARDPLQFCRSRYDALVAVKDEFGEERFVRLLYSVVAPPISQTYLVEDESADTEQLRSISEGCP